jgi:hypothetical protein
MIFIETPVFTEDVQVLLTDDEYGALQGELANRPDMGEIIRGTGGLRKVRWGAAGKGKRGGVRAIYYWRVAESQILMLVIYSKSVKDDLTADQRKVLRKIVENWQ